MDTEFCVEALKEALAKYGTPEIFKIDQVSQFTSGAWIDVLIDAKVKVSMDGNLDLGDYCNRPLKINIPKFSIGSNIEHWSDPYCLQSSLQLG